MTEPRRGGGSPNFNPSGGAVSEYLLFLIGYVVVATAVCLYVLTPRKRS